jgi:hypothetical protein
MNGADLLVGEFLRALDRPFLGDAVFDAIEDVVYFVKDRDARYVAVNPNF